jgi:iron complex transport system ATP-binding protein
MSCDTLGSPVRVTDLAWGPKPGNLLIRDISFGIEAGDRLAIVGPNGAGKTSLLRCLYRGAHPLAGKVEIDGLDLKTLSPRQLARKIGVVLQEMPADFPFTARDVVMMGRVPWREGLTGWNERDHQAVMHALEHLAVVKLADRQFSTLSGGEKQRVLVARALAQDPQIIILDEPTNHLDIRHQLEILELLSGLQLTIITTLHDINLAAAFASHVAIMHDGEMTAFGSPEDILTEAVVSETFGVIARLHEASSTARPAGHFTFSRALN